MHLSRFRCLICGVFSSQFLVFLPFLIILCLFISRSIKSTSYISLHAKENPKMFHDSMLQLLTPFRMLVIITVSPNTLTCCPSHLNSTPLWWLHKLTLLLPCMHPHLIPPSLSSPIQSSSVTYIKQPSCSRRVIKCVCAVATATAMFPNSSLYWKRTHNTQMCLTCIIIRLVIFFTFSYRSHLRQLLSRLD